MVDSGGGRLRSFSQCAPGGRSIIEGGTKAYRADCPPDRNDGATLIGNSHTDDFSVAHSPAVSADHYHSADGGNGKSGQAALANQFKREPK